MICECCVSLEQKTELVFYKIQGPVDRAKPSSTRVTGRKKEKKNHSREPALIFIGSGDDAGRRHGTASHRSSQAPPTSKAPPPPQTSVGVARQEG